MNTMGQQQQSQQATIAVSIGSGWSCTPHLPAPDYRWYVHYEDFQKICKDKASDASALRGLETMTNNRIRDLRRFEDIPVDALPNEDDLWIEISGYGLAEWNIDIYSDRTYNHSLVSLIDCGFLRRRFVAYPGRYMLEPVAATIYRDRLGNPFIIVDNDAGDFIDDLGEPQNAKDAGYTVIRRQYLYQIEAINAALSKLAGQSPPVPMPRWHSLQRKALTSETTTSTASQGQSITSQQTSVAQCLPPNDDNHERDKEARKTLLFANKNNTDVAMLSLENPENRMSTKKLINNSVPLHSAPWSPETLIALSSCHLAVPDPAQCDEEQWRRDWLEPAQWLIDFTSDLDCTRAWEIIERYICAMIAGPTWHARKANKSFVSYGTLRHVVGWHKETLQLDGHNWKSTADALRKEPWADYAHIEYAGPPLFDECAESSYAQAEQSYAQGYTAQSAMAAQPEELTAQSDAQQLSTAQFVESTAQVLGDDAQSSVVEVVAGDMQNDDCAMSNEQPAQSEEDSAHYEETAQSLGTETAQCAMETETTAQTEQSTAQYATSIVRRKRRNPGMLRGFADTLFDQVSAAHPLVKLRMIKLVTGFYEVSMQVNDEQWYTFERFSDWEDKSPEIQRAIDAAEAYGKQRNAAEGNDAYSDSQGPPGYGEVSEEGGELQ